MLQFIVTFNLALFIFFTLSYLYQIFYAVIGVVRRPQQPAQAMKNHRYAVLIAARNERAVIAELIDSIKKQNYPRELLDIFVIADNCTDDTAAVARRAGVTAVYERFNHVQVGKGYALDHMLKGIARDYGDDAYEGYFVFDADNLLDENFVCEMNKCFDQGHRVLTSFRNSKNFASNWISAGYSLWFMRESRYLNYPRMRLGTSCAISGTGFLVHNDIIRKNNGWKHHLLTEDIEFSVDCVINGETIGYCPTAVLYDEQPCTWSQSWSQRLRWAKGFYQVFGRYHKKLIYGFAVKRQFACYDMFMTIAPALFISLTSVIVNGVFLLTALLGSDVAPNMVSVATDAIFASIFNFYMALFLFGLLTTITEWKKIHASAYKKIFYVLTFPIFIFTYVPISIVALFKKIHWSPITHSINRAIEDMVHQ
ncbi:MAG: glycosyltransferase family 2 protein [Candidatus Fimivivens sp.]